MSERVQAHSNGFGLDLQDSGLGFGHSGMLFFFLLKWVVSLKNNNTHPRGPRTAYIYAGTQGMVQILFLTQMSLITLFVFMFPAFISPLLVSSVVLFKCPDLLRSLLILFLNPVFHHSQSAKIASGEVGSSGRGHLVVVRLTFSLRSCESVT